MPLSRKYTIEEIKELVDAFRSGGEGVTKENMIGMDMLVEMLNHFGKMTDAEVAALSVSAYRVLRKDEILKAMEEKKKK